MGKEVVRYTEAEIVEIKELRTKQGKRISDIADKFQVADETMRNLLKRLLTPDEIDAARKSCRDAGQKIAGPKRRRKHKRHSNYVADYECGSSTQCTNISETCPCNRCVMFRGGGPPEQKRVDNAYKAYNNSAAR